MGERRRAEKGERPRVGRASVLFDVEAEKIEGDPENQEPEYLEKIRLQNEENEKKAADENAKYEKIKKKIKLVFVKPEVFKNKRKNIGGFVMVEPNDREIEKIVEVEEVVIEPEKKEDENENENGEEAGEDNAEQKEEGNNNVEANEEQQQPQEGEATEEKKQEEGEQQQQPPQEGEQQQQPPQEGEEQQPKEPEEPQVQSNIKLYYINTLYYIIYS